MLLFFPFLTAQWGIADDHEIQYYMGKDANLSFAEIPSVLLTETEAGMPGTSVRYRPVYYLFRLVETALWGEHPTLWYAARILLFSLFLVFAWRLFTRYFGAIYGGIACMPLLFHSTWTDIFGRLGPSEAYAVPALSLYAYAAVNLVDPPEVGKDARWWWLLTASSVIAIGAKENMLFLLASTAVLSVYVWRNKRINGSGIAANLVIFGFGLFVLCALVFALRRQGADIYGRTVMPISRGQVLLTELLSPGQWKIFLPFYASCAGMAIAKIVGVFRPDNEKVCRVMQELKILVMIVGVLVLLWYAQVVFYNGRWQGGSRYDFPAVIFRDLSYILVVVAAFRILPAKVPLRSSADRLNMTAVLVIGGILLVIVTGGMKAVKIVIADHTAKRNRTVMFTQRVSDIATSLKGHPGTRVFFISHSVQDFEAIDAVRTLLSFKGVTNPLALQLEGWSEHDCPQDTWYLLRELREISEHGQPQRARGLLPFVPSRQFEQAAECFAVTFSGRTNSRCRVVGEINKAELF